LCDNTAVFLDLTQQHVSQPFDFQKTYVVEGKYWRLREKKCFLNIYGKIQIWKAINLRAAIMAFRASGYAKSGKEVDALAAYHQALELDPKCEWAYIARSVRAIAN
jgi:hypothetical protein